jgi:acetyltransferase-like isoleucine patch superfamily enzyme
VAAAPVLDRAEPAWHWALVDEPAEERRPMLRAVARLAGYPPGATLPLWLANVLFQRVLRLDSACRWSKHYTSRVLHPQRLVIENDCPKVRTSLAVSGGCYLNCGDGLWIGEGTIWSANVAMVSQDHDVADLEHAPVTAGIRIGRHCWIGFGAAILPGVTLGDRTIVGANAVVRTSFPEGHVVVAGSPARIVRALPPVAAAASGS